MRSRSHSRSPEPKSRSRSRSRSPRPRQSSPRPSRQRQSRPPPRQRQSGPQHRRQQRTFGHAGLARLVDAEINNIAGDVPCMNDIASKCAELDLLFSSGQSITFADLSTHFPGESFPIMYTYIYCTFLRKRLENNLSKRY